MTIYMRANTYHLRKRVPRRFRGVEPRDIVAFSLHTDSKTIARQKADQMWGHLIEGWEAALRGDSVNGNARWEAAKAIADRRGFSFLPADQVAALPLADRVARLEQVPADLSEKRSMPIANALLGGVVQPGLTVRKALEEFWKITVDQTRGKTDDQVRRWENPRKKAVENFVAVVGDVELQALTRADARKFRDWWNEQIDKKGLSANSANKDFTHLAHTLKTVNDALGLELTLPISGLRIKATPQAQRKAFSAKWIKDKILAAGALDGLNIEARTIVLMCVNTGARPSEIAGLLRKHAHLDGKVPYITIAPEGRQLKNAASARTIPLVGCSLDALKVYLKTAPKARDELFPRYFGKDAISAAANKFLAENGLLETPDHTLYGLRHGFEDRMIAADWPERFKADLFGHAIGRERYGESQAHVAAFAGCRSIAQ